MDKANANGGGTVFIPRRFNKPWLSGKLNFYANVKVLGEGIGDTLQSATADTLITYKNNDFTHAEGAAINDLIISWK